MEDLVARINREINEEIERRAKVWIEQAHGFDFAEKLQSTLLEVEQLKAELESLKNPSDARCMEIVAMRDALKSSRAECRRLRKALESIQKGPTLPLSNQLTSAKAQAVYVASWSQETAHKALQGVGG